MACLLAPPLRLAIGAVACPYDHTLLAVAIAAAYNHKPDRRASGRCFSFGLELSRGTSLWTVTRKRERP